MFEEFNLFYMYFVELNFLKKNISDSLFLSFNLENLLF